jgi:hypothetical protein
MEIAIIAGGISLGSVILLIVGISENLKKIGTTLEQIRDRLPPPKE